MSNKLTPRELKILLFIAVGLTDKEIGQRLVVTRKTVQSHLQLIYTKLRVHNRTSAVVKAYKKGYLDFAQKELSKPPIKI